MARHGRSCILHTTIYTCLVLLASVSPMATKLSSGVKSISISLDQVPYHSVIAAIDFGTSGSGYAFGFRDKGTYDIRLADIQLNKWQIGSASTSTAKAPTTVLLKPDRSLDTFGYKAEDKYAKLCERRKQKGWWYFQKFKMMLYKTKRANPCQLNMFFSAVIGHIKGCILDDVKKQNSSIKDDDILYVLTVPAIWSDAAKQFMREAATQPSVGMADNQLKLVLEPEAASLFCRQRKSRVVREINGTTRLDSLEIGHKYIMLDLGGGTADIATHKIIDNGQLLEIDFARGDNIGGQKFNESFLQFLSELSGEDTFKKWRLGHQSDFLQLQRDIEGIKWETQYTKGVWDDDLYFEIPYSLFEHVQNETGNSVGERLSHSRFAIEVKLEQNVKLFLKAKFVRSFFYTILTGVAQHVSDILRNTSEIETIFMVGGLAKSSYVVKYIKTSFPQRTFIVPEDPGVAVLKGAVMLGNKPQTIAGRIARYSYGVGIVSLFVEGKHDEKYKCTIDGRVYCDNIFGKLIEKGQVLKYGDSFEITTTYNGKMPETKQRESVNYLYQSTSKSPSYYSDPGCSKLGGFIKYPPKGGWPDITKSNIHILVGEAEFRFYVTDTLGHTYETTLEFLAQTVGN